MVYWLFLNVVEQRAEEEGRETAAGGKAARKKEKWPREKRKEDDREKEDGEREKGRRSETGGYRPRRRLVYGSADAHHLLKKTCCSKCVHFACTPDVHRPVGTTKSPIVSHSASTFRSGGAQVAALSFFDKRQSRGETVSQRRLTCRRGYSGTTNFVSSEFHAPIARRRFA